tara:strand:+ start:1314 stop:2015 length:702 start_codon:yes stop_codon:yes gene_type:complete
MGIRRGEITTNIIRNGLVFNLDAANRASYVNGNTETFNTTNLSQSGSLTNGISFNNVNKGIWEFDGSDDYIDLGNLTLLNGATNASWGFWANVDTTPNQMPISQWDGSNNVFYVYFNGASTLSVAMNGGFVFSTSYSFNTGEWEYFTITLDGGASSASDRVKGYVNGAALSNSTSGVTSLNAATSNFNIGRREASGGGFYFDGKIPNLHIYNRTLSAEEVLHNYNGLKGRFGL